MFQRSHRGKWMKKFLFAAIIAVSLAGCTTNPPLNFSV
ncbi:lipoprotein [Stenotrophomonas sp. 232]|nr:lipoprotein [Stenotrophomonas sp. 232]MBF9139966.1 lipoprotein [Stenotrophomonas sp. 232]